MFRYYFPYFNIIFVGIPNLKYFFMRKLNLYTGIVAASLFATTAIAQPKPVESTAGDISMKDLAGNTFTLYGLLDEGYTVVIDLSATWCPPCWGFHSTHTLKEVYEKYGPEGTVTAGKIMPVFIEGDPGTTTADLEGTTSETMGNWVEGTNYPIFDAPAYSAYLSALFLPGTTGISFPTFFVICPDRKIVMMQEGGGGDATEEGFVTMSEGCAPTGINDVVSESSVSVYPNPATDHVGIAYTAAKQAKASLTVTSITGQVLYSESFTMTAGDQYKEINIGSLASGMYVVTLSTGSGDMIRKKITKK